MRAQEFAESFKKCKVTLLLQRALSSYFFPPVTAALSVLCYYTGLDILFVWYLCLSGTAIMLCCDDVTPALLLMLFMNVMISMEHNPSDPVFSDYFTRPAILAQEAVGVVIFVCSCVFRLVTGIICGRVKITPVFWGLVALSAACMLGGLFYTQYTVNNFIFGLVLAVSIVGSYLVICGNVKIGKSTFLKISVYLLVFFAVSAIELVVAYCTYDNLLVNSEVDRRLLRFGWGTYNQMGFALTLALPAWFYLSSKFKYGFIFILGAIVNVAFCYLSMSRQAMLIAPVLFFAGCVWRLVKERGVKRLIDTCIVIAVIVVLAILLGVFHKNVGQFFSSALVSLKTGSGRLALWKEGLQNFLRKPVFGVGWYDLAAEKGHVGYTRSPSPFTPPYLCHNTIVQLLCSCGLLGLITYVVHRVQTVFSFLENPSDDRIFIAMTVCAMLFLSLLDIHIFRFFPSILYAIFLGLLSVTEKKGIKNKACKLNGGRKWKRKEDLQ